MDLLFKEIQTTQDVINKIKDMRQGLLGTALVSVMNEVSVQNQTCKKAINMNLLLWAYLKIAFEFLVEEDKIIKCCRTL